MVKDSGIFHRESQEKTVALRLVLCYNVQKIWRYLMLPEAFLDRMKTQLGTEYQDFLESLVQHR